MIAAITPTRWPRAADDVNGSGTLDYLEIPYMKLQSAIGWLSGSVPFRGVPCGRAWAGTCPPSALGGGGRGHWRVTAVGVPANTLSLIPFVLNIFKNFRIFEFSKISPNFQKFSQNCLQFFKNFTNFLKFS